LILYHIFQATCLARCSVYT